MDCRLTLKIVLLRRKMALLNFRQRNLICSCTVQSIKGKILTKQQIYEEVWGEEYFYDDSNIMAIISRLRKIRSQSFKPKVYPNGQRDWLPL